MLCKTLLSRIFLHPLFRSKEEVREEVARFDDLRIVYFSIVQSFRFRAIPDKPSLFFHWKVYILRETRKLARLVREKDLETTRHDAVPMGKFRLPARSTPCVLYMYKYIYIYKARRLLGKFILRNPVTKRLRVFFLNAREYENEKKKGRRMRG